MKEHTKESPRFSFVGFNWVHIFRTLAAVVGVPVLLVVMTQISTRSFDYYDYLIALSGGIGYLIKKWSAYTPESFKSDTPK